MYFHHGNGIQPIRRRAACRAGSEDPVTSGVQPDVNQQQEEFHGMKRRSTFAATAVAAVAALLISACSSSGSSSSSSPTPTSTTGAVAFNAAITSVVNPSSARGGTLIYDNSSTPDSLDPSNTHYARVPNLHRPFPLSRFTHKSPPRTRHEH